MIFLCPFLGAVKNMFIGRILIFQKCTLLRNEYREKAVPIPGANGPVGAACLYSDLITTLISEHPLVFTCTQLLQVDATRFAS